jgi:hypothetical protein
MNSPETAGLLDEGKAQKALDQLFQNAGAYRKSSDYQELFQFMRKFPAFAPYNCFLLHVQKPGAAYVATARQWRERFGRTIKPGARPLVILVPFGPVEFVYDVLDTEGKTDFPKELLEPFKTDGLVPPGVYRQTVGNLYRDRVRYEEADHGANWAGSISAAGSGQSIGAGPDALRAFYVMLVNKNLDRGAKYATLVHELAHLYCGHLGTPDDSWWPDRRGETLQHREFEAESAAWLVCERAGIKNPSAEYLSGYLRENQEVPAISLDAVLKAVGYIEMMGRKHLQERKKLPAGERAVRSVRVE